MSLWKCKGSLFCQLPRSMPLCLPLLYMLQEEWCGRFERRPHWGIDKQLTDNVLLDAEQEKDGCPITVYSVLQYGAHTHLEIIWQAPGWSEGWRNVVSCQQWQVDWNTEKPRQNVTLCQDAELTALYGLPGTTLWMKWTRWTRQGMFMPAQTSQTREAKGMATRKWSNDRKESSWRKCTEEWDRG